VQIPLKFRSVLVATLFLVAPFGASATRVLHEGAIFNASGGGVSFSSLHTSTDGMGHGSNRGGISGDVAYTWETGGGNLGTGTTITFDQGATTVFSNSLFEVALWTSSSVLTVGAANSGHGSIQGVAVTHDISGEINFEIRQISGANSGAVLADTFEFDTMTMGPVNGIGSAGGSPESFNTNEP
jgi:hypothetical protein